MATATLVAAALVATAATTALLVAPVVAATTLLALLLALVSLLALVPLLAALVTTTAMRMALAPSLLPTALLRRLGRRTGFMPSAGRRGRGAAGRCVVANRRIGCGSRVMSVHRFVHRLDKKRLGMASGRMRGKRDGKGYGNTGAVRERRDTCGCRGRPGWLASGQ